jgi:hypothetical protein
LKKKLKTSKTIHPENPNGWTDIQLVEKTKYLPYKAELKLSKEEKVWLEEVIDLEEDLKRAYQITNELRDGTIQKMWGRSLVSYYKYLKIG